MQVSKKCNNQRVTEMDIASIEKSYKDKLDALFLM